LWLANKARKVTRVTPARKVTQGRKAQPETPARLV
jgi:hypothetical protein